MEQQKGKKKSGIIYKARDTQRNFSLRGNPSEQDALSEQTVLLSSDPELLTATCAQTSPSGQQLNPKHNSTDSTELCGLERTESITG